MGSNVRESAKAMSLRLLSRVSREERIVHEMECRHVANAVFPGEVLSCGGRLPRE